MSGTFGVPLDAVEKALLEARAKAAGLSVEEYAERLVTRDLANYASYVAFQAGLDTFVPNSPSRGRGGH